MIKKLSFTDKPNYSKMKKLFPSKNKDFCKDLMLSIISELSTASQL
jgi:hypothetical protein